MNEKTRFVVSVIIATVLFAASIGGSYALSLYAISQSQRNWCSVLTLLTANPAQPTTAAGRQFYSRLHTLEDRFGC